MTRNRSLAVLAAIATTASLAASAGASAKSTITLERLDVGLPARHGARQGVRRSPSTRARSSSVILAGRLRHRHHRRLPQARDDRHLLARPAAGGPGRHRLQQDRPRRRLRRHQPATTRSRPLARSRSRTSSPGASAAGARCRARKVTGPIDLVVRTAASGTQDAFQNIFMGQALRVAGSATTKSSNGLQAADDQVEPERDRLRRLQLHRRAARRALQGRRCYAAQRQVRPVRRRRATSGSSRAASRSGAAKTFIRFARTARPRSRSSRRTGSRCASAADGLATRRPGHGGRGQAGIGVEWLRRWPDSRVERLLGAVACSCSC